MNATGKPPDEPNSYGDGALLYPTKQWCALGAFGIWWPNAGPQEKRGTEDEAPWKSPKGGVGGAGGDEEPAEEEAAGENGGNHHRNITHQKKTEGGTEECAAMKGQTGSSTRAGTAAMAINPARIAIAVFFIR